ncbi:MAG: hypothetical protein JWP12_977 [Bacteroidetes bacterium]|nr:hypothetical protein [Bacteroidota bacterium]
MKSLKLFFIQLVFAPIVLFAQSGMYMNATDYTNNKLSYEINCDSSAGKIKLNHFLAKNYVDVICGNKKTQLKKDSIFGYRACDGKTYRFFKNNDQEFLIVENRTIVIYIADVPVVSSTGKTTQLVPHYFFSTTLSSEIYPLTLINLKKAFPGNIKFHDLLDVEFNDLKNSSAYDAVHKMYRVNYLASQSVN